MTRAANPWKDHREFPHILPFETPLLEDRSPWPIEKKERALKKRPSSLPKISLSKPSASPVVTNVLSQSQPNGVAPPSTAAASNVSLPPPEGSTTPTRNGAPLSEGSPSILAMATTPTTAPVPMPEKASMHGAPVRQYLNTKVVGSLMEGMKRLAAERYVYSLRYRFEAFETFYKNPWLLRP